jgi:hypothetical protein
MHYYQRVGFSAALCTGINYDSYDYEYPPNFRTCFAAPSETSHNFQTDEEFVIELSKKPRLNAIWPSLAPVQTIAFL